MIVKDFKLIHSFIGKGGDDMKLTSFQWQNGSLNDNIRSYLHKNHIPYHNTFNGDVVITVAGEKYKAYPVNIGKDLFEVYAEKI